MPTSAIALASQRYTSLENYLRPDVAFGFQLRPAAATPSRFRSWMALACLGLELEDPAVGLGSKVEQLGLRVLG